jgi:hypothetical protein
MKIHVMKTRIILLLSLFLVIGFGCSRDEGPSVEQNKQTLAELPSVVDADLGELTESEGMKAINTLLDLFEIDDPMGGIFKHDAVARCRPWNWFLTGITGKKLQLDGGSGFDELAGTYSWDPSLPGWSVNPGVPPDKIIITFPTEGSNSNNAVLTISDFEEEMFLDDWDYWVDTIYVPTRIMADLTVDGTKYIELSFTATWSSYEMPSSISASLMIKPLTATLDFSDNGSVIAIAASLSIRESVAMSFDLQAPYTIETDEWGEEMIITGLSGFVHYGTVKLTGNIDIGGMENAEGESEAEALNQFVRLALYNYGDGSKIADIRFVEGSEDVEIQLVFTDGSIEPAGKYLDPILDKIEEQLGDLMDAFELEG